MAKPKELTTVVSFMGDVDPSLLKSALEAGKIMNKFQVQAQKEQNKAFSKKNFQKTAQFFKGFAKSIGVGLLATATAVSMAIGGVAKEGIALASSMTEVQNVVSTTFGAGEEAINKFADTALEKFGVSELNAKQFNGTLGAMFKSMGIGDAQILTMSQNLSALSGDMASFYNLDTQDAFDKIRAGISGETEPLKQLGINMSVTNLEDFAVAQGQTAKYADMSQADQAMLRYAYLMQATADAQGDFNKTSGEYANQQRLVQENFKQLSANIMQGILPSLAKMMQSINEFMTNMDITPIQELVASFGDIVIGAIPLIQQILPMFVDILTQSAPLFFQLIEALLPIISSILPLFTNLLTMVLPIVSQLITLLMPIVEVILTAIIQLLTPFLPIISALMEVLTPVIGVFASLFEILIAAILPILELLSPILTLVGKFLGVICGIIELLVNLIKDAVVKQFQKLVDMFKKVGDVIRAIFGGGKDKDKDSKSTDSIDKYANGGFASRASIFGEAGLEAAIPIRPRNQRSLSLLARTASMLKVPQQIVKMLSVNKYTDNIASGLPIINNILQLNHGKDTGFSALQKLSNMAQTKSDNQGTSPISGGSPMMSGNYNSNQTFIINYKPVISGGDTHSVQETLQQGAEDIREIIEDIMYQKSRVSYG